MTLFNQPSDMNDTPEDIFDPDFVKGVFDRCSEKYILFSLFCSFGFTEIWRKQAVANMPPPENSSPQFADLMSGTGEIWPHLLRKFPNSKNIYAIDISEEMHLRALDRLHKTRSHKITFKRDNVLKSELKASSFDGIIASFGLKTFNHNQQTALAELVAKVLRKGGSFSFVEASDPQGWLFRPLYNFYLKSALPLVEKLFLNGAQDFAMIGRYTEEFQNCRHFAKCLQENGLTVQYREYFFGCATGVTGTKP